MFCENSKATKGCHFTDITSQGKLTKPSGILKFSGKYTKSFVENPKAMVGCYFTDTTSQDVKKDPLPPGATSFIIVHESKKSIDLMTPPQVFHTVTVLRAIFLTKHRTSTAKQKNTKE